MQQLFFLNVSFLTFFGCFSLCFARRLLRLRSHIYPFNPGICRGVLAEFGPKIREEYQLAMIHGFEKTYPLVD